jgi:hypothetical protein
MKNVTISMDETVAEWVRLEAARRNTSVSRLVGELLAEKMQRDSAYERAYRDWREKKRTWKSDGAPYPKRDDTYAERLQRLR